MRRNRFSEEQIVAALKQMGAGRTAVDLGRKLGGEANTSHTWSRK